ncbi:2OG-Fe(II) oxygenase [Xanthomonas vesicatoria]|uniref:2OG-Fe(II) oxygenase n=2 Tax=Xanthomonas vesicatoria TaxID=56460 RepID=A0AAJ0N297_9XANT|nr:2OG-Fe(II) oxygenase [Xanthomonas vesicatoria]APO96996.1 2OG-Fe(II) oxygenase [Xanthomonas vesicatoria]KHM90529.1 2OG-Fe(II) oxygenase [Xanthomonas vesicatoria]KHM92282.1 2OG-Fe(II) oxygenase [Xanthomonas vesicatoria]MCC8621238.1 2OG-Fe(II) oxygenase [Xanthomonas vesicatoria]MCC8627723.1 2OG-Fe(II) oxygenase [Xanthomonas vesicatoria]
MHASSLAQLTLAAQSQQPAAINALAQALVRAGETEQALAWYARGAAAGDATAQIEAGRMLAYGIGGAVDVTQAIAHWQHAERSGVAAASYLLATLAVGEDPRQLGTQARARLHAAAAAHYPPALRALAIQYGRIDHPQQQQHCVRLLEQAAAAGDVPAAALLAERLLRGEGVTAQPEAAKHLLQQLQPLGVTALPEVRVAPPDPAEDTALDLIHFTPRSAPTRLHQRPTIERHAAVLSADECRLLILLARPHLRASQVVDPDDASSQRTPIRTSRGATLDPILEDFAARAAQARLAACVRLPLTHAEPLSVLCYAPGEQYRAHRDYLPASRIAADRPAAGNRQRTVCVYLNAVQAGGDTEFPVAGVSVQPCAGAVVCFDNLHADGRPDPESLHAGLPVTAGTKWLATLWFRQQCYRDW